MDILYYTSEYYMEMASFLLVAGSVLYGLSGSVGRWSDFRSKLTNVIAIIVIIVLSFVTCTEGICLFYSDVLNLLVPVPAVAVGYLAGRFVKSDDWKRVAFIVAVIAAVASVVLAYMD